MKTNIIPAALAMAAILLPSCSKKVLTSADATTTPVETVTTTTQTVVATEPEKTELTVRPTKKRVDTATTSPIFGKSVLTADQICTYIRTVNPDFDCRIAEAFIEIGNRYGIRGDVAVAQSVLETGWFKFADGTAVTPDQHNYCGMGVTQPGAKGNSFDTIEDGVTAQIQHLYAYACDRDLPRGERVVDPRYKYVRRGVAPTWDALSGRWAINPLYAERIMDIYARMAGEK